MALLLVVLFISWFFFCFCCGDGSDDGGLLHMPLPSSHCIGHHFSTCTLLHFYKSKNWIFLLLLESIFWVLWIHKNKKTPLNFIFLNLQKMKMKIIIVIIFKKSIFGVVNLQGQKMHPWEKVVFSLVLLYLHTLF